MPPRLWKTLADPETEPRAPSLQSTFNPQPVRNLFHQKSFNISKFQQWLHCEWIASFWLLILACLGQKKEIKIAATSKLWWCINCLLDASSDAALRLKLFLWHRGRLPDSYCFIVMPLIVLTGKSSGPLNHESSGVFLFNFSCNKAEPDDTFRRNLKNLSGFSISEYNQAPIFHNLKIRQIKFDFTQSWKWLSPTWSQICPREKTLTR